MWKHCVQRVFHIKVLPNNFINELKSLLCFEIMNIYIYSITYFRVPSFVFITRLICEYIFVNIFALPSTEPVSPALNVRKVANFFRFCIV